MKRVVLIIMLMCVSFTMAAQDDYKNSVSIGLGSVIGTDVGFSPAVDLRYRKELTDNIGLNVGIVLDIVIVIITISIFTVGIILLLITIKLSS